ncbi:MAG: protein kinase [Parasphingorhabdus sp.]|uniref:serine/threonine protein kinase n=1 Tax=Parasphingorhabdus sp. TaxID=2709688 RepID=UPI003299CE57
MTGSKPSVELAAMELFELAMEQAPEDRKSFLSNSTSDELTKKRALQLLEADKNSLMSLRTGGASSLDEEVENAPEQIGAYRILRLLGRGGMGSVYMGERVSDDFDHIVAIKLIKPGLLSDALVERFRRERQILAQLNHQHIAHLHDGGEQEDGSPYIVMEYVDGISLSHWIEAQKPDLDRRLNLFAQICDAVEFAHQNLVIHRDLTPSNVLITEGDQVKLIDFGIARPKEEGDDSPEASTFSGLSLTPGFGAPERSQGAEANTLSDIYSLGRILQVLIREFGEQELNAIAAKAASSAPEDRYATVRSLSDDIANFRNGFPVGALSGSSKYRFRKFVMRQKFAVGATAAVILLLIAGIGGTSWAYSQAEFARAEAERRFTETRSIAKVMLFEVYDAVDAVPGSTSARRLLANTSQHYLDALTADPNSPDTVKLEAATGYKRLADVVGGVGPGTLGLREQALANYERADHILTALYDADPANEDVAIALAELRAERSNTMVHLTSKFDQGLVFARSIEPILDRDCSDRDRCITARIKGLVNEGQNLMWSERQPPSLVAYDRALVEIDKLSAAVRKKEETVLIEANIYRLKSKNYHFQDKKLETVKQADIARRLLSKAMDEGNSSLAIDRALAGVEFIRGGTLDEIGQTKKALPALNTSYSIMKRLVEADKDDLGSLRLLAIAGGQRAVTLASAGKYEQAIEGGKAALAIRQRLSDDHPDQSGYYRDVAIQLKDLGEIYRRAGRRGEACHYFQASVTQFDTLDQRWTMREFDRNRPYAFAKKSSEGC